MMVFWKAGLAFLAVPKTGTQAYAATLGAEADILIRNPPDLKHMTAQRFRRKFLPMLDRNGDDSLETLAVIREPLDWLGSWYRYRGREGLKGHPNSTAGLSFDQFVEGYLAEKQPAWATVGSQHRFVTGGKGKLLVDHLFAYEDQAALRDFLGDRLGHIVEPPPRRNGSPPRPQELSPDTEARLRERCAADFALHETLRAVGSAAAVSEAARAPSR